MVVCIVIALAGIISIFSLPVEQYPEVAPPQIRVNTSYRGADAETIANTLAAPLEEEVNGVEGMIYMDSTSSNNGEYTLYVTFATGTDSDMALVRVQNRVSQVQPQLPQEVVDEGITVETSFSDTLGFLALTSPNGTYDELELMNGLRCEVQHPRLARPDAHHLARPIDRGRRGGYTEPEQAGLDRLHRRAPGQRHQQPARLHADGEGTPFDGQGI